MRTTWPTSGDPAEVLDLLQQRLAGADEVTAVDRTGDELVVRSRDVPTWAYLLSLVIPVAIRSVLLRPRTERVLRIAAVDDAQGRRIELSGGANAAVSKVLLVTSHQLLPDKVDAWDDD